MSLSVLVIDYSVDWRIVLKNAKSARGTAIVVEQSEWSKLHVEVDSSNSRAVCVFGSRKFLSISHVTLRFRTSFLVPATHHSTLVKQTLYGFCCCVFFLCAPLRPTPRIRSETCHPICCSCETFRKACSKSTIVTFC